MQLFPILFLTPARAWVQALSAPLLERNEFLCSKDSGLPVQLYSLSLLLQALCPGMAECRAIAVLPGNCKFCQAATIQPGELQAAQGTFRLEKFREKIFTESAQAPREWGECPSLEVSVD